MSKVQSHHLERPAYVYVRQSTMGQVRHHHESTERQYDLRNRAVEMMWAPGRIRILDQDLGQSGAQTTTREDFKTLVADVSLGRVGAIFALEASRLARSNLEWHRLIEICALTRTLVIDEDGCYDPADFNDALLLGISMVRWIRYKHRIPAPDFQRPGERSVRQVADELGVSRNVVYYWIERGVVTARRPNPGSPYWIAFDDDTKETLRAWVRNSSRI